MSNKTSVWNECLIEAEAKIDAAIATRLLDASPVPEAKAAAFDEVALLVKATILSMRTDG